MQSKFKWLGAGTIIGFALGGIVLLFLYKYPPEQIGKDDSKEILDFAITSWTNPEPDSVLAAYFGDRNKSGIFQLGKIPDTVYALAAHIETVYAIPKGVVIAQWILESKWGLCHLGAQNYQGLTLAAVRRYMPYPAYVIRRDTRYQNGIAIQEMVRFARFKNIEESFEMYGRYISGSPLYRSAFKPGNSPEKFARELAKHYAADLDYALKLIILMRKYKLN